METQLYNNGTAIYPVIDPESKPLIVTLTGLDTTHEWEEDANEYVFATDKTAEEIKNASDINIIVPVAIASAVGYPVSNDIILSTEDKGNKTFSYWPSERFKLRGYFSGNLFIIDTITIISTEEITNDITVSSLDKVAGAALTNFLNQKIDYIYSEIDNLLIVNVTTDLSSTTTSTTTWKDLYAAYTAGKLIYIILTDTTKTRTYSNVVKMQLSEELQFYTLESGILYILTWNALGITLTNSSLSSLLTLDSTPTINSSNPVTSDGLYTAFTGKQDVLTAGDGITIANNVISAPSAVPFVVTLTPSGESDKYTPDCTFAEAVAADTAGHQLIFSINENDTTYSMNAKVFYANGDGLIISGFNTSAFIDDRPKIAELFWEYGETTVTHSQTELQSVLRFDDTPTSGSNNSVKSGGVFTALQGKADRRRVVDNSQDASVVLGADTYNQLGTTDAPVVSLPASYTAADEFLYSFTCATDACVVTLPQGVVLADCCDDFSEVAAGVWFQVSIMDGVAAYLCVTPNN